LKFTPLFVFLSILVLGCAATPARADITVMNPSFENGVTLPLSTMCGTNCSYNFGPIQDWAMTGTGGLFQPNSTYYSVPVPDGSIVAWSSGGTISQTLTAALTPNTTYMLSVDVGHRLDEPLGTNYSIALYAGNTLLAMLPPSTSTGTIPIGTFADETLTYTSGATVAPGDLRIVLSSAGNQANFDDVTLTTSTVPEPSSLSLLAGGLGLLIFALRRR
jgi:hypothetical protein